MTIHRTAWKDQQLDEMRREADRCNARLTGVQIMTSIGWRGPRQVLVRLSDQIEEVPALKK